jgi:DNA polymerase III subunit alpha
MKFTHIHTHSQFSVRDGLLKLEDIVKKSAERNEAFALTDHGNISGWPSYASLAKKYNVKPIYGVEVYINKFRKELVNIVQQINSTKDKDVQKELSKKREELRQHTKHLVFVARNETGFYNIIEIMNEAYINYFYSKPLISYDAIESLRLDETGTPGLIVTTACLASPLRSLLTDSEQTAIEWISYMKSIIGKQYFFLEVQGNGIAEQIQFNEDIIKLSKVTKTPMIFGSDSHYMTIEDSNTHQDLLLLQNKKTRNDVGKSDWMIVYENKDGETKKKKVQPGKEFRKGHPIESLKEGDKIGKDIIISIKEVSRVWTYASNLHAFFSEDELKKNIKNFHKELIPYIDEIFMSNKSVYDMIDYIKFNTDVKLPSIENASKIFVEKVKAGLKEHEFFEKKYIDRVKYEMNVIQKFGFETYFLILADLMEWAKVSDIGIGSARGSSTGSFVAFLLGIHTINPFDSRWDLTGEGLPFERFLAIDKLYDKIIIQDNDGKTIELLETKIVKIKRGNDIIMIEAGQIKEGDVLLEE